MKFIKLFIIINITLLTKQEMEVEQGNMEYPFLGVSYKIDNPPYGPVTLVPYIEADNAPEGTTVKSNVIIADNSSDPMASSASSLPSSLPSTPSSMPSAPKLPFLKMII